jgi:hypothetical protein
MIWFINLRIYMKLWKTIINIIKYSMILKTNYDKIIFIFLKIKLKIKLYKYIILYIYYNKQQLK